MSLDPSAVGFTTAPCTFSYDWKAVALYALGIGAKKDELDYLYEARGPRVYPSFAVCPAMPAVFECLRRVGGEMDSILHAGQSLTMLGHLPREGELRTTATLRALYDWKKFGQAVVHARTTLTDGEPVFETGWSILYRGEGNFGGPRPPREAGDHRPPKDRAPDFRQELATLPEQALLYRLSGDLNPLHADPDVAHRAGFENGPILHGLCTYGFVARAIILGACGGDASRLVHLEGQFRKPVWPGDTIIVQGYRIDESHVAAVVTTSRSADAVMSDTWAEITSEAT